MSNRFTTWSWTSYKCAETSRNGVLNIEYTLTHQIVIAPWLPINKHSIKDKTKTTTSMLEHWKSFCKCQVILNILVCMNKLDCTGLLIFYMTYWSNILWYAAHSTSPLCSLWEHNLPRLLETLHVCKRVCWEHGLLLQASGMRHNERRFHPWRRTEIMLWLFIVYMVKYNQSGKLLSRQTKR